MRVALSKCPRYKGGVTLGNDSCNLSCNSVLSLAGQVAGMVLHCAVVHATCLATVFCHLRDKLLEWCYTVQRFMQLVLQQCLSLARQVTGMVLHRAMILATCLATVFVASETSYWNGVTLRNDSCNLSCNGHCSGLVRINCPSISIS